MIRDIMHVSKKEYEFLIQRNKDLELYTDYLIKHDKELIEENKELKKQIENMAFILKQNGLGLMEDDD